MNNFNQDKILKRCFKSITKLSIKREKLEKENNSKYLEILQKEKKLANFISDIVSGKYKLFQKLKKDYIKINNKNIKNLIKTIKNKEYFNIFVYRNKDLENLEIYYDKNLFILNNGFYNFSLNEPDFKKLLLKNSFIKKNN